MKPYHADDSVTLYHGDCITILAELPDASVDAVVTDPPYGLGFMGKAWDAEFIAATTTKRRQYAGDPSPTAGENGGYRSAAAEAGRYDQSLTGNVAFQQWCQLWAEQCLRVLKPGGHLLAFGGTRTSHRLTSAIEDAGFEIRDSITWLYGSGFPKSMNVALAIDKAAGATAARGEGINVAGVSDSAKFGTAVSAAAGNLKPAYTDAVTTEAQQWAGWGTALKPAHEPITVARKPLTGTVAANVLEHGTGALNIDGCRIGTDGGGTNCTNRDANGNRKGHGNAGRSTSGETIHGPDTAAGRWPANVVLDESQAAALDRQSGNIVSKPNPGTGKPLDTQSQGWGFRSMPGGFDDSGGASRFFYIAKAGTDERPRDGGIAHPTVKPLDLMRWLTRLVTPPGGIVLDPFAGSGTTAEACIIEGFRCITVEQEADYLPLIVQRISKPIEPVMF